MSRGIALALSAITGMCAVAGSSARMRSAATPLMPGRLMSIRITSGRAARAISMPRSPSLALSKRMSGRRAMRSSTSIRLAGLSSTYSSVCMPAGRPRLAQPGRGCGPGRDGGKLRLGRQVQLEPEHAALPDRAFHADDAAHQFDQPLAYDEADARPFLDVRLLSETVERLEQLRQLARASTLRRYP